MQQKKTLDKTECRASFGSKSRNISIMFAFLQLVQLFDTKKNRRPIHFIFF